MLNRVLEHRKVLTDHDISFLAGAPTVLHCHHFNLFWDQTIDDALGPDLGAVVRTRAAREAFYELLSGAARRLELASPEEKLNMAQGLFSAMGQGRMELHADAAGGEAKGEYLHYGFAWHEKYGRQLKRHRPADAVAAGFAAAATEVAFDAPRESINAREKQCLAKRDPYCTFSLVPGDSSPPTTAITESTAERALRPSFGGRFEAMIREICGGLRNFTHTISGDDRGLVQAFGLYVTMHLSTYYSRTGYDALRHVSRNSPQSVPILKSLFREAGHVCAFNTFGGILLSPEWEGLVGPLSGDERDILAYCAAIGRALGFGHWTIHDHEPNERLVVRTPSTYESIYYVNREAQAEEGKCLFFQGAALALMQLANRVPWTERPQMNQSLYDELFRSGLPWRVEETMCISKGDPYCESLVERVEPSVVGRLPA